MAIKTERVEWQLTARDQATQVMRGVEGALGRLVNQYGKFLQLAGTVGGGLLLREAAQAALEAEQAGVRIDAVLAATGNAAGRTRQQLDDMADSMAQSTIFDDESLRDAQAQFLKFGNIQEEVFDRGMKAAADYASFTGSNVTDAAQTIGKALQSPLEGTMMLERQMGKLTYEQKENIRVLVEQGRLWEAQNEVLRIVESRVGGTAEKMNTGLTAATRNVAKAWDELMETMGRMPAVQSGTISTMDTVTRYLHGWKVILESGTWVDKLAQVMTLGSAGMSDSSIARIARSGDRLLVGRGIDAEDEALGSSISASNARAQAAKDARAEADAKKREEAAKRGAAEAKRLQGLRAGAIEGLQKQLQTLNEMTEVEKLLADIEGGRYGVVTEAWKQQALAAAIAADTARDEKRLREEIDRIVASSAENELRVSQAAAERLANMRNKYLDLIDPLRQYKLQLDEVAELVREGKLDPVQSADAVRRIYQEMYPEIKHNNDALATNVDLWKDFGVSAGQSLEEVILKSRSAIDVVRALGRQLAAILLRQNVTNPLAKIATAAIGSLFGTTRADLIASTGGVAGTNLSLDSYRAEGGPVMRGQPYIVGEEGPELMVPNQSGTIVPNSKLGGGSTFIIDARGADRSGLARLESMIRQLDGSLELRAVSAVTGAASRGGTVSQAIRGP